MPKETVVNFRDALYDTKCPVCDGRIFWTAQFYADGTNYHARCCNHEFAMYPHTVVVENWKSAHETPLV